MDTPEYPFKHKAILLPSSTTSSDVLLLQQGELMPAQESEKEH